MQHYENPVHPDNLIFMYNVLFLYFNIFGSMS